MPKDLALKAIEHTFSKTGKDSTYKLLNYGERAGDKFFREQVALWYGNNVNFNVKPENIFGTAGNSQAFELILNHLVEVNDTVFVEAPTYHCCLNMILQTKSINVLNYY